MFWTLGSSSKTLKNVVREKHIWRDLNLNSELCCLFTNTVTMDRLFSRPKPQFSYPEPGADNCSTVVLIA